jgi:hypothetical protein
MFFPFFEKNIEYNVDIQNNKNGKIEIIIIERSECC